MSEDPIGNKAANGAATVNATLINMPKTINLFLTRVQGVYKLVLFSSENGLLSLNKLGTTPKAFGEYLKTAKGGEIIV